MKHLLLTTACILALGFQAHAQVAAVEETNMIEELDPFDPNIEAKLSELDKAYEQETGQSAFLQQANGGFGIMGLFESTSLCNKATPLNCNVFALIKKSEQKLYLYVNGQLQALVDGQLAPSSDNNATWVVSTGLPGHETPTFDTHPNGRIYDAYSSSKFPGGDYMGLGNMPYAVFISGGFAMHGTPVGNYKKLGRKASHGCVRMRSENGKIFNRLVRQYGIDNTWIRIVN